MTERKKETAEMRRRNADDEPSMEATVAYLEAHPTPIDMRSFLEVMKLLKNLELIGALSISALNVAYALAARSAVFRAMTPAQWRDYFVKHVVGPLADGEFFWAWQNNDVDFDGDENDNDLFEETQNNWIEERQTELLQEWDDFPADSNFFHVFIAFLARFSLTLPSKYTCVMTKRIDEETTMHLSVESILPHGTMDLATLRSHGQPIPDLDVAWMNRLGYVQREDPDVVHFVPHFRHTKYVPFIYHALQAGWRFDPEQLSEMPKSIQSCVVCGDSSQPLLQCGGQCGLPDAIYCGTECQRVHWYEGHRNHCLQ